MNFLAFHNNCCSSQCNSLSSLLPFSSVAVLIPEGCQGAFPIGFNMFQKVSEATNRQLRNSKTDLRLPLLRTSTGQKSFAYRGAKVWSDLDIVVKASSSFYSFRRKYKPYRDSSHFSFPFFVQDCCK